MIEKIKNLRRKDSGFTIVELLIVIVVIGILAAITIVSYTGITQQAKTAHAQQNASSLQAVADAFNVENNSYPAVSGDFALVDAANLPAGLTILTTADPTATNGENSVRYQIRTVSSVVVGGAISYYDFTGSGSVVVKYVGDAKSGDSFTNPAS